MKILLFVVSALLVITAATSGYFIINLNSQISDLEQNMTNSLSEIVNKLDDTRSEFNDEIRVVNTAIQDTGSLLDRYITSAESMFQTVETDIKENTSRISSLSTKVDLTDTVISDSVLRSTSLYDQVKESIVVISDGRLLFGSGFITFHSQRNDSSNDTRVWTAYHVVKDLSDIYMTFHDGRTWKAVIKYYSEELDIAMLDWSQSSGYISSTELLQFSPTSLEDSSDVKPGDPVFVLGSPGDDEIYRMGFKQTLTTGVISQINRCATVDENLRTNLLQFDAPVNYGNSGSPLFNSDGDVIGLVIARMNPSIGDGIGLAVTSNQLMKIDKFVESTNPSTLSYPYPWTGITIQDLLPVDIVDANNSVTAGAKVTGVSEPARNAGVKVGDIITGLGNLEIRDSDEFYCYITEFYNVGDTVSLEIIRDGVPMSVSVTVQAKP